MVEAQRTKTALNGVQQNDARNKTIGLQMLEVAQIVGDILLLLIQIAYSFGETIYRYIAPPPPKPVKGEIVLITGAGHGMGKELALLYAAEGATVVGWDVNMKSNEETISEINQRGYPKAHAYYCDVSNRENVLEVAKKVQKEVGDVTILFNNAGIMPTHPLLDHTKQEIEKVFAINVLAHFWTIEAFLPTMKKNNYGHIVALSSCVGLFGLENLVPYCGSKFAVRGFMEALGEEIRYEKNCKVELTTVCPYMVDTGLCKRPKIKFQQFMALLKPMVAAEAIMRAQRTNQKMVSIPGYISTLNNFTRLLPERAAYCVKDFINAGVDSDL